MNRRTYRPLCLLFVLLALSLSLWTPPVFCASSALPNEEIVPPGLRDWKAWVLHGSEDQLCPVSYSGGETYLCGWPSRLRLKLEGKKGTFSQEWLLFAKAWVPLPGGTAGSGSTWPQDVLVDESRATVVEKNGAPSIELAPGTHRIEGAFVWEELPETIRIPAASGLVELAINGRTVDFPILDPDGRLWLQKRKEAAGSEEDRLEVRIYRLLTDSIPMQVTNLLKINVSGHAREIRLGDVLLENSKPMSIRSSLPARLGSDGGLLIQARPGRFEIEVETRMVGPVHEIGPVKGAYGEEVWSFRPQTHLRMVEVENVPAVDPNQTDIPSDWKSLSSYIVEPDGRVSFKVLRRGDPDPAPDQLHLTRTWWLDFDGRGYTIQDRVTGTMSRNWRLAMNPPVALGRVSVDGVDQLITSHGAERKPGVELRKGQLNLSADSRIEGPLRVPPAIGWDHDFQSVSGVLNLPPGWRLLAARGVDVMPGSWFERWTLLDLFLVLIISMAVFQLRGRLWGVLTLVTLTLIYHEAGAPGFVWLSLLAASALLRFLPDGWARKIARAWWLGSIVILIVIAIPFMLQQIRWGIYPQLETGGIIHPGALTRMEMDAVPSPAPDSVPQSSEDASGMTTRRAPGKGKSAGIARSYQEPSNQAVLKQDPHALIQTGPGLPSWQWRAISMQWNGPVDRNQKVGLWLLSPAMNRVLAFVRVVLPAILMVGLIGGPVSRLITSRALFSIFFAALALSSFASPNAVCAAQTQAERSSVGYPPPELLQKLEDLLLEKPDCLPNCSRNPRMELFAGAAGIRILLEIHAAARVAAPLPGSAKSWLPDEVFVDDRPAEGLSRDNDGVLWVLLSQGVHRLAISGRVPPGAAVQIPLALRPDYVRVHNENDAWEVRGVHSDGQVESTIQLVRRQQSASREKPENEPSIAGDQSEGEEGPSGERMGEQVIEPFFRLERVLSLGLDWQVRTTVTRLTPPGVPVVLSVPLLHGESVTAEGLRIEEGRALVHLKATDGEIGWESSLDGGADGVVRLQAPESVPWTETWVLDASPIWHCELSGIPVIHHQDQAGYWKPRWQPWPGESVTISVTRPEPIAGQLTTIDLARLEWTPGVRFSKAALNLRIRSSQGGQYKVRLPENPILQAVKIGGKSQPISPGGGSSREITIPLQPGAQNVAIEWHQGTAAGSSERTGAAPGADSGSGTAVDGTFPMLMRSPPVELGQKAVNGSVAFRMPANRWILWTGGPRLGPAVLFWSYLVVVILAGIALGRTSWTPLKTHHWLLLGLGLAPVDPFMGILIIGWLIALGLRKNHSMPRKWFFYDLIQVGLVVWTIVALASLYFSVQEGLLGVPDMQIAGNGSNNYTLNWTQDRIDSAMPAPWVLSLPLYVYRILMLLWALWLAQALLRWLRWGWQCLNEQGLWKKRARRGSRENEAT
jgi:hypothetical protein